LHGQLFVSVLFWEMVCFLYVKGYEKIFNVQFLFENGIYICMFLDVFVL